MFCNRMCHAFNETLPETISSDIDFGNQLFIIHVSDYKQWFITRGVKWYWRWFGLTTWSQTISRKFAGGRYSWIHINYHKFLFLCIDIQATKASPDLLQPKNRLPARRQFKPQTNQRQLVAPAAAFAAFDAGPALDPLPAVKPKLKTVTQVRREFPEAWIWTELQTGYFASRSLRHGSRLSSRSGIGGTTWTRRYKL